MLHWGWKTDASKQNATKCDNAVKSDVLAMYTAVQWSKKEAVRNISALDCEATSADTLWSVGRLAALVQPNSRWLNNRWCYFHEAMCPQKYFFPGWKHQVLIWKCLGALEAQRFFSWETLVWLLWYRTSTKVKMSAQGSALANALSLDDGKADLCGQQHLFPFHCCC